MKKKRILHLIFAFGALGTVLALILFRNSPRIAPTGLTESFPEKPSKLEMPSSSNVAASFAERIARLKKSVDEHPKNAAHRIALAQLLMDGHRTMEAIQYFEQAAVLQPSNDSLLLDLSVCYFNEKQYAHALRVTTKILVRDKNNSRALYNKGAILATMGRKTEAITAWKELLQNAPKSEEAKTVREHISLLEKQ
ncbi:MAG: tetratricopeptide repeat protein [Bacteroidota bacterium]|jgi:tetratricopeptide (TPR) repeat protein